MKKTKHFNISVPELGDVPDITQVSNAISDLEDATAGTLEIMKAEMQGTKIALTSVSRKTKRTGYYEGMSIRFKSPQDIEPNYLKTISVDGLGDQTLSVEYKVNRNEYIDIVYEGNKFTAYPVVVQKTDSVNNNSSVLVGTAKGVKTAYDKGVEALNKANQAQTTADKKEDKIEKKSGFNLEKSDSVTSNSSSTLATSAAVKSAYDKGVNAERIANTKEPAFSKKSGFNLDKSDSVTNSDSNILATSLAAKTAYDKGVDALNKANQAQSSANNAQSTADGKVSKSGDTMTGRLEIDYDGIGLILKRKDGRTFEIYSNPANTILKNPISNSKIVLYNNGYTTIDAPANLKTNSKEVIEAINELNTALISIIGNSLGEIQEPGLKTPDKIYVDRATRKLYRPLSNTSDTQVTGSFRIVSLLENSNGIGFGQKYKIVEVKKDTIQTNNTGRPIFYSVTEISDGQVTIYVDGLEIAYFLSENNDSSTSFIVPAGSSWYWTGSGSQLRVCELS